MSFNLEASALLLGDNLKTKPFFSSFSSYHQFSVHFHSFSTKYWKKIAYLDSWQSSLCEFFLLIHLCRQTLWNKFGCLKQFTFVGTQIDIGCCWFSTSSNQNKRNSFDGWQFCRANTAIRHVCNIELYTSYSREINKSCLEKLHQNWPIFKAL